MNQKYIEGFKTFLEQRGYCNHISVDYKHKGPCDLSYWYVDVKNEENDVIQVFILLSTSQLTKTIYPIWESYDYIEGKNGLRVYPAVFIVTQCDDGKWIAYSASDTNIPKDSDCIINYKKACKRFKRRVDIIERYDRMVNTLKWISWSFSIFLTIYLIAHVATNMSGSLVFPLTSQMVLLSGLIIVLILLPIVFPYIKSVSLNGIDLLLKGD